MVNRQASQVPSTLISGETASQHHSHQEKKRHHQARRHRSLAKRAFKNPGPSFVSPSPSSSPPLPSALAAPETPPSHSFLRLACTSPHVSMVSPPSASTSPASSSSSLLSISSNFSSQSHEESTCLTESIDFSLTDSHLPSFSVSPEQSHSHDGFPALIQRLAM